MTLNKKMINSIFFLHKIMKNLISLITYIYKSSTNKNVQLGRWSLKTCNTSHASSFYANRDHCGDIICKIPKKYDEQQYLEKIKDKTKVQSE